MHSEAIRAFLLRLDEDEALRTRLTQAAPASELDALQAIADMARELGLELEPEELRDLILGPRRTPGEHPLTDADLEQVSGGAGGSAVQDMLRRGALNQAGGGLLPDAGGLVLGKGPIPS
jgi:hypothetical protein